jgi:hypothetical protein
MAYDLMMSVSDIVASLSVENMGGGEFSRSMMVQSASETAQKSCGLKKVVFVLSRRVLVRVSVLRVERLRPVGRHGGKCNGVGSSELGREPRYRRA